MGENLGSEFYRRAQDYCPSYGTQNNGRGDGERLSHARVLGRLTPDYSQPESDIPRTHQDHKQSEQESAAPFGFCCLKLNAAMRAMDFPRRNGEVNRQKYKQDQTDKCERAPHRE
jgi:hypothetical protein